MEGLCASVAAAARRWHRFTWGGAVASSTTASTRLTLLLLVLGHGLGQGGAQRFGRPLQSFPQPPYPEAPYPQTPGQRPHPGRPPARPPPDYPAYGEEESGLGAACRYDDDCATMEHTFCLNHQTCECKTERGFVSNVAGDRCVATVGASCSTRYDCSGLGPTADCRQSVCDCGNSYVPAPDGTCLKGALKMNDSCEEDLQCETLGEGVVCKEGACRCAAGRHYSNQNRCVTTRALNEPCSDPAECFIGEEYRSIVTCYAGTGTCRCREHYVDDHYGKCTSGAKGTTAVLLTTGILGLLTKISVIL